jgi:hypothetical protein
MMPQYFSFSVITTDPIFWRAINSSAAMTGVSGETWMTVAPLRPSKAETLLIWQCFANEFTERFNTNRRLFCPVNISGLRLQGHDFG